MMLARTYEEALRIYTKYRTHILGVISDVDFPKNGELTKLAGFDLCEQIRVTDPFLPIILQSSENKGAFGFYPGDDVYGLFRNGCSCGIVHKPFRVSQGSGFRVAAVRYRFVAVYSWPRFSEAN